MQRNAVALHCQVEIHERLTVRIGGKVSMYIVWKNFRPDPKLRIMDQVRHEMSRESPRVPVFTIKNSGFVMKVFAPNRKNSSCQEMVGQYLR